MTQETTARHKVLMVDDDPDVRNSVARGLRHSGFDVRVAVDGRDALTQLAADEPDALVLDVQMPELDGVAVVTALRALGNDIPICVLSARDTVNDRIAGLEAGADDYLTKPLTSASWWLACVRCCAVAAPVRAASPIPPSPSDRSPWTCRAAWSLSTENVSS